MITKYQYIKDTQGNVLETITHIMSEHGHFERNGLREGYHISAGSQVDLSVYTEVIDEGVTRTFRDNFPDIIKPDTEETDEDETEGAEKNEE